MKPIKQLLITLLLCVSQGAFAISYTYDNLNRLQTVDYGSGQTITYSYDSAGNMLSIVKAGTGLLAQTITWGSTPTVVVGGTGTVSATASSGLAVTFSGPPSNAGKCSLSGTTVTGIAVGQCSIYADQAGNATYSPATQGFLSFQVTTGVITPPSAPTSVSVASGPGRATLTFQPPVSTGGAPIVSYTATCIASGQTDRTATGASSPLVVSGLTAGVAYACSVTANNGTSSGAASSPLTVTPGQGVDITPILMLLLLD